MINSADYSVRFWIFIVAISHLPLFFPLCRVAYGSKAHFLNILLYLLGLLPLTYLMVSLRPSMSINGTGHHNITMVKVSFQEVPKKLFD